MVLKLSYFVVEKNQYVVQNTKEKINQYLDRAEYLKKTLEGILFFSIN